MRTPAQALVCSAAMAMFFCALAPGGQQFAAGQQAVASGVSQPAAAQQLFSLANQARAAAGAGPLHWDSALAAAAFEHCRRMAAEGPIAHRYAGEPELATRAQGAGGRFSLIEENVALASRVDSIHRGWLASPGHRANLLNAEIDSVGIAVVWSNGFYYAAADYARAVPVLAREQVEAQVATSIRAAGSILMRDPSEARAYCSTGSFPSGRSALLMIWETPDVFSLPRDLALSAASGRYRSASAGACAPHDSEPGFTSYRIAVILYLSARP